jgi:hypothetical protein
MNEHLTDRMPEVANRRARWSSAEERHLAACADCRREWQVVTAIATAEPAVDVDRVVTGVLAGLRETPRVLPLRDAPRVLPLRDAPRVLPLRRRWRPMALAAAAAAVLAVGLWGTRSDDAAVPAVAEAATWFPELDALLESELEVVLASLEPTPEYMPIGDVPRLGDLTDDELEQLLDDVEG